MSSVAGRENGAVEANGWSGRGEAGSRGAFGICPLKGVIEKNRS